MLVSVILVALVLLMPALAESQEGYPSKFSKDLANKSVVREALQYVDEHFEEQLDRWIRITEIPGPATMALLGLGFAGLAVLRRRRRP